MLFADLVGFTRLGERSELERIGTVAKLLEQVAIEVTNPEVRLVKLIGDAAMMVSEDGTALLDAALRFIEVGQEAGDELPALRVGVARGPAISQAGASNSARNRRTAAETIRKRVIAPAPKRTASTGARMRRK